jgi:carbon storage regulator CsrA
MKSNILFPKDINDKVLMLTCRVGEGVMINDGLVKVYVQMTQGNQIRLMFAAPEEIKINRWKK